MFYHYSKTPGNWHTIERHIYTYIGVGVGLTMKRVQKSEHGETQEVRCRGLKQEESDVKHSNQPVPL